MRTYWGMCNALQACRLSNMCMKNPSSYIKLRKASVCCTSWDSLCCLRFCQACFRWGRWTYELGDSLLRGDCHCLKVPCITTFLSALLALIQVVFHVKRFHTEVVKPLVCGMSIVKRSFLELLRYIHTSSWWLNFYGHSKVSPIHLAIKFMLFNSPILLFLSVLGRQPVFGCCSLRNSVPSLAS